MSCKRCKRVGHIFNLSTLQNAPVGCEGRKRTDKRNAIETNEIDTAEIPEFVYESLARSLLPVIQKYYESDEGKRAFTEWKEKKDAEKSGTT